MPASAAKQKSRKMDLAAGIGLAFTAAVVPVFLFLISYSYRANSRNLYALTKAYSERSSKDTIAAVDALLAPAASALRMAAALAAIDPQFFKDERSRDYLFKALTSSDQIDALYASFEDGYHRVVTRVDAQRRKNDPKIPANAHWHSSFIEARAKDPGRTRHRTFFETWPKPIKSYDVATPVDIRELPHYKRAKETQALSLADPSINPDTGGPVISMGFPILHDGRFIGFVGANITFNIIADFLAHHKVSPRSVTMIIDSAGRIIAHPELSKGVQKAGGLLAFADIAGFPDAAIADAARLRKERKLDRLIYPSGDSETEYVASFNPFPESFAKKWEVLTVTPTGDFLGALEASNRRLLLLMSLLVFIEVLLIFVVSKKLAEPINALSIEMEDLRSLTFTASKRRDSPIQEVAQLQKAVSLLQNSLKSFAAFVPVGVVRRLISSGRPLTQRVESKELTFLFTDLENFTAICESLPPEALSEQLSGYFEKTTAAITEEGGTIDKFIGDAVMAFWGAPSPSKDQIAKACRAALRIAHRARALNALWSSQGKPSMHVRIGLHHGPALVGNIGSSDRLSYTAIGDAVNVASRLEGINKQYGTTICVSDDVLSPVKDRFVSREIGVVKVKGREHELKIHELLGVREGGDDELDAKA